MSCCSCFGAESGVGRLVDDFVIAAKGLDRLRRPGEMEEILIADEEIVEQLRRSSRRLTAPAAPARAS